jgi:hypothetical protein
MRHQEIKEQVLEIKELLTENKLYSTTFKFRDNSCSLTYCKENGIEFYGKLENTTTKENPYGNWGYIKAKWEDLTDAELGSLEEFLLSLSPERLKIERDRYLINFTKENGDSVACDLKNQTFVKYGKDGKKRNVKYVNDFFKGFLGHLIIRDIPADDHFKELMRVIVEKETRCRNFGTFLTRMFDNIHLETYIAGKKPYDVNISVGYDFFPKDCRKVLDAHNFKYDSVVELFFANNVSLGQSMFSLIKDDEDFADKFKMLSYNMPHIVNLIENFGYDFKSLYKYCADRYFDSDYDSESQYRKDRVVKHYKNFYGKNLLSYIADFARMADMIWEEAGGLKNKYPKNIIQAHDYVTNLFNAKKEKFDEKMFQKLIDERLEYSKGDLCVIHPQKTLEITNEGSALRHCVGSYVRKVIEGQSRIMFVRLKEEKDKPLLTVELKDRLISQARGYNNRRPNYDEQQFLRDWAKQRKLVYNLS